MLKWSASSTHDGIYFLKKYLRVEIEFLILTTLGIFLENHTHVKTVGKPQNFCLAFVDELKKQQLFIKKMLKWANKKM